MICVHTSDTGTWCKVVMGLVARTYLKIIFWHNICVGFGFQALTNTTVCPRLETRIRLDLEPKYYCEIGSKCNLFRWLISCLNQLGAALDGSIVV